MEHNNIDWKLTIPGGCHWSGILRRGTTLRLTDIDGNANVAALFYNQEEKLERYNMADTLKAQHTFYLTQGHACYSDMGRIFCCITADTAGWHDTVCGLSNAKLIEQKYGTARYQAHRNQMFRSGLDGILIELGKWGLGLRDVVANINFFSKVTANQEGQLTFQRDHRSPNASVDLSFEMNTLVVLSMAPHPLDTAPTYAPGPVQLSIFPTQPTTQWPCSQRPENIRGRHNTQQFYCLHGGTQ